MQTKPAFKLIPAALLILAVAAGIYIYTDRSDVPSQTESGSEQVASAKTAENAIESESVDSNQVINRGRLNSEGDEEANVSEQDRSQQGTLIRVFDAQGNPAADASVLPWLARELWREHRTDSRGEVWVEGLIGAGGLVVKLPGWRPDKKMLVFDGQPVDWQQADGVALSGHLICDTIEGDFPPVALILKDKDWRPSWENIPRDVFDDLEDYGWNLARVPLDIQPDGSFRIDGLATDWRGVLTMPAGFFGLELRGPGRVDGPEDIELYEPSEGLVIKVMELPKVSGQLLTPDGSEPAVAVQVEVSLTFPDGTESPPLRGVSDAQGYFELPLVIFSFNAYEDWIEQSAVPAAVAIQFQTKRSEVGDRVSLDFDPAELENPWHLGAITLEPRQTLAFQTVDPDGKAIAGAFAYAGEISEATNAQGYAEVFIPQEGKVVAFMAEGYSLLEYTIPKDLQPPAIVELQPSNQVLVRLELPDGIAMEPFLQANAKGRLFGSTKFQRNSRSAMDNVRDGDYRLYSFGTAEDEVTYWRLPVHIHEFVVEDVVPGIEFTIQLVDGTRAVLADSGPLTLKAGEQIEVDLKVAQELHHLWGRVLDPTGSVVGDAQVQIQGESGGGALAETTADGRFDFGWLLDDQLNLQISRKGYALSYWPQLQIPPDSSEVDLSLSAIRELRLHVVDGTGRNLGQAHISYGMKSRQDFARWIPELEHHLVYTAPHGEFEVFLKIGGLSMTRQVPAGVNDFDLVVEVAGGARLKMQRQDLAKEWKVDLNFEPITTAADTQPTSLSRTIWIPAGQADAEVFMPALMEGTYRVRAEIRSTDNWQIISDDVLVEGLIIESGRIHDLRCDI